MDGMKLLAEAEAAGLQVQVDGNLLRIRGPQDAGPVARKLLAHKPAVINAIHALSLPDPPIGIGPGFLSADWHEVWEERVAIMVEDGKLPLEHAEAKALADVIAQMERAGIRTSDGYLRSIEVSRRMTRCPRNASS